MVAPSCCLEYQPTVYFWLILIFIVFPIVFLTGKVINCFISILLKMLKGLCRFLILDDENNGEVESSMRSQEILKKAEYMNSYQRLKTSTNEKVTVTSIFPKASTRNSVPVKAVDVASSDISDSLHSDCEEKHLRREPPQ